MSMKFTSRKNRRGQGLVEYIVIVAAVAMIALVAVSIFGHKVADQYAIGAGMLPGAHAEDNTPIATESFAGSTADADGNQVATGEVSWANITGSPGGQGLENNVITQPGNGGDAFVAEHEEGDGT